MWQLRKLGAISSREYTSIHSETETETETRSYFINEYLKIDREKSVNVIYTKKNTPKSEMRELKIYFLYKSVNVNIFVSVRVSVCGVIAPLNFSIALLNVRRKSAATPF